MVSFFAGGLLKMATLVALFYVTINKSDLEVVEAAIIVSFTFCLPANIPSNFDGQCFCPAAKNIIFA